MMCDHAMDLPCDFNTLDHGFAQFIFKEDPREQVEKIMQEVHMSWVRFIKTGDPNPGQWAPYTRENSLVRIYDKDTKTVQLDRSELMQVWGDMRFYE